MYKKITKAACNKTLINNECNFNFLQNSPLEIQHAYYSKLYTGKSASEKLLFSYDVKTCLCNSFNVLKVLKFYSKENLCFCFARNFIKLYS